MTDTTPTPETAQALLYRHGLPEDVIDGVLCLHAQELAAVQRREADDLHQTEPGVVKGLRIGADLIDPAKVDGQPTPAVLSGRALRDRIASALSGADEHSCQMQDGVDYPTLAAAVVGVLAADNRAGVRCPSCEHEAQYHDADGRCWFTVEQGVPERDAVCSCLLRRLAAETQQTQTETRTADEDPARIDRLRPEFTDHASIESIDAQLRRARSQERRWHLRTEWLISLRQSRVEQKARGQWPAAVVGAAAADTDEATDAPAAPVPVEAAADDEETRRG